MRAQHLLEIKLITTGGTIDGTDSEFGLVGEKEGVQDWLKTWPGIKVLPSKLFNKDSREITAEDRESIANTIAAYPGTSVLITHGTFTIVRTAEFLKHRFTDTDKTILLVGAWRGLHVPESDAPQQLAFALSVLSGGHRGVWIAMDERLWDPNNTEKRRDASGVYRLFELS